MKPENLEAGLQTVSVIGQEYLTIVSDTNWRIGGTGDFNGDGKVDILWRHYGNGKNALWFMDGSTIIGTAYLMTITDLNWIIMGTGDFNGDGNTDILLGGNLYRVKPEVGRYDASYGHFLAGNGKGDFTLEPPLRSGFRLEGEIRDIRTIQSPEGPLLLVARNNAPLQVFRIREQ